MDSTENRLRRWISGIPPAKELLSATGTQILEMECRQQQGKLRELIGAYSGEPAIRSALGEIHQAAASNGRPAWMKSMI